MNKVITQASTASVKLIGLKELDHGSPRRVPIKMHFIGYCVSPEVQTTQ
jgi:hypothetical protein